MTGEYRTLLEAIIREQRNLTWAEGAQAVERAATKHEGRSLSISARHLARLGKREGGSTSPTPAISRALEYAFGHSVVALLSPYDPEVMATALTTTPAPTPPEASDPKEALTLAASRAQEFAINLPGVADLTVDQVVDGVRDLAVAYPVRPLPELLGPLVNAQETVFGLLERPQRPSHGRQLYFLAGVVGGMLAKASHDLADPSAALTQSRTAFLCADQADHPGLRGWISGLQSLIAYWAGRPHEAIRYAQRGAAYAGNTSSVWLASSEARAWAQLGNAEQTRDAIRRAEDAWPNVELDELDEFGGMAVFTRPRQLYYAADALAWLPGQSQAAKDYATQAVEAYADPTGQDWAFGDQAGSHCDLAVARIHSGELDGAAEAVGQVLSLPVEQRIGGVIKSVKHVHRALGNAPASDITTDLQEQIEAFARTPLRAITA